MPEGRAAEDALDPDTVGADYWRPLFGLSPCADLDSVVPLPITQASVGAGRCVYQFGIALVAGDVP